LITRNNFLITWIFYTWQRKHQSPGDKTPEQAVDFISGLFLEIWQKEK